MAPGFPVKGLILLAAAHYALSATYSNPNKFTGQSFLDVFNWETKRDANYGRVNYINLPTAKSKGLVNVSGNQVTLSVDSTTKLSSTGPGRDGFYLKSRNQYTTHVAIFDIAHMPEGCGTWPAVWLVITYWSLLYVEITYVELGPNWPNEGEIDIVEGVNNQSPNTVTLHTSPGCTMPSSRQMSGRSLGNNCDTIATNGVACGVAVDSSGSFGPSFNANGGGWYAIERTSSFIKVWFWSRWNSGIPCDISSPGSSINTDSWGEPAAYFPSNSCDFAKHIGPFNIMIDIDFCGAWAGTAYNKSGCPSNCIDYVNSNPSAFQNAYFTFNGMTIYQG